MALYSELKRRNVLRVSIAYLVVVWLIQQVSDSLSPLLLLPGWLSSTLVFILILGFPVAVLFAWAYEITPEGVKREKDVERAKSITQLTGRKLDAIIIGLLIVAIGYFAVNRYLIRSKQLSDEVSLGAGSINDRSFVSKEISHGG